MQPGSSLADNYKNATNFKKKLSVLRGIIFFQLIGLHVNNVSIKSILW